MVGTDARRSRQLPLTIALIEDSSLLRLILDARLGELSGVEVVGGADEESTAIELLRRRQPDLAIVDLKLRAGSGLGVLQELFRHPERFGHPKTVVFSHHDQALVRERCFALGADRFFDKATQMEALLDYVRRALSP